jgi:hypothetical protein
MTLDDDPLDDMHRFDRDDELLDRLLDGEVSPDDAPRALAEVAAVIQRAGGETDPGELADEDRLVAAMAAVRPDATGVPAPRRTAVIHRVVRAKVAAGVVVSALGIGAAAAAVSTVREPERPRSAGDMEPGAATTSTTTTTATTLVVTVPSTPPTTSATAPVEAAGAIAANATTPVTRAGDQRVADEETAGLCTALHGTDDKLGPPALAKLKAAASASGQSLKAFCTAVLASERRSEDEREAPDQEGDRPDDGRHPGQGGDDHGKGGEGQGRSNGGGDGDHGRGGG